MPGKLQPWIAAALGLVLVAPSFGLPWSLIDDGMDLARTERFLVGVAAGFPRGVLGPLVEPGSGRILPAFWAARAAQLAAFGLDPTLHHLVRSAIFAAVLWLTAGIARQISPAGPAPLVAAALLAFFRVGQENWFRLGTQEPYIVFWAALSLYLVMRGVGRVRRGESGPGRAAWIGVALAPLAQLSKEPGVVLAPLSLVLAGALWAWCRPYAGRVRSLLVAYGAAHLAVAGLQAALVLTLPASQNDYITAYTLAPGEITRNATRYLTFLSYYWPLAGLAMAWLAARAIAAAGLRGGERGQPPVAGETSPLPTSHHEGAADRAGGRGEGWQFLVWPLAWVAYFLGWLVVQSPWSIPLPRYLLPAVFGLSLALALPIGDLWQRSFRNRGPCRLSLLRPPAALARGAALGGVAVWLSLFVAQGLVDYVNFARWYLVREESNGELVSLVARESPRGARLYVNLPSEGDHREWLYELRSLLVRIHGRSDLEIVPLTQLSRPEPGSLVVGWSWMQHLSEPEMRDLVGGSGEPSLVVERSAVIRDWTVVGTARELTRRLLGSRRQSGQPLLGVEREVRSTWQVYHVGER